MDKRDNKSIGISLVFIELVFLFFIWFVSDPAHAGKLDRYMLYYIDDVLHYCYVRTVDINLLAILNPSAKPLYTLFGAIFYKLAPLGTASLRIMNSLLSVSTLFVMYKLMKKIGIRLPYMILAVFMTAVFPLYFLASIASLTEIMFTLFFVLSLYFLYCEKYLLFSVFISMFPLIRQEGLFFLIIGALFLLKQKKINHAYLVFMPSAAWALINYLTMKYSIADTFFYIFKLTNAPPGNAVGRPSDMGFLYSIIYSPVIILGIAGVISAWRDRKFYFLKYCLVLYFLLLGFCSFKLFIEHGIISRELRYLICAAPLLSIFAARFCMQKIEKAKKSPFMIIILLSVVSLCFTVFYIRYIQNDRGVLKDSISKAEETELWLAADWLQKYMAKEKIDKLYVFGQDATGNRIRKIWMSVCPLASLYSVIGVPAYSDVEVLDMTSLKRVYWNCSGKFVFVSLDKNDAELRGILSKNKWQLLKEFPVASVFFYSS